MYDLAEHQRIQRIIATEDMLLGAMRPLSDSDELDPKVAAKIIINVTKQINDQKDQSKFKVWQKVGLTDKPCHEGWLQKADMNKPGLGPEEDADVFTWDQALDAVRFQGFMVLEQKIVRVG